MLRSRELPPEARRWIEEYVAERLAGAYGHNKIQLRVFRAQVELPAQGVVLDIQPQPAAG